VILSYNIIFLKSSKGNIIKLKITVHEAKEGGYCAQVPLLPGCPTQGHSFEELLHNLYKGIEGYLSVDIDTIQLQDNAKILEIVV
jgi:predicted RNase H-like HicB family nuclease